MESRAAFLPPAVSRRRFLTGLGLAAGHIALQPALASSPDAAHPRIFIRADGKSGLPDVDHFRRLMRENVHAKRSWGRVRERAKHALAEPALTPSSTFPGRHEGSAKRANPDYTICHETGQRLLQLSLLALLEHDRDAMRGALRQLEVLFSDSSWPEWIDTSHKKFGVPTDLRTGMLGQDVALAYDWLHPLLSPAERSDVLEGLRRKAVEPYLRSVDMDAWWLHEFHNWLTVIVGGLGVAGMATDGELPEAGRLMAIAAPLMEQYLGIYGPEGEFNESPAYGGANRLVVGYYNAERFWSGGTRNRLAQSPIPEACHWVLQTTLPPGRPMGFGDCHPKNPVMAGYISAVAGATQDPVLQGFYRQYAAESADPRDFLWPDHELAETSPAGSLPQGRTYDGHGGVVVSRSGWDAVAPACVVYGKAGKEQNHEHNDAGQVCIDGLGERLIIDIGSPSGYPADFFEEDIRWRYYNASTLSHNVLMIDGAEQLTARPHPDAGGPGRVVWSRFDDSLGGAWKMDLTAAYPGAERVERTVVHLLPGIVAVLDRAVMPREAKFSLRWHTIREPDVSWDHSFVAKGERAVVIGRMAAIPEAPIAFGLWHHEYAPPYDRDRLGDPLEQRRESFFEATATARDIRWLTLFAVGEKATFLPSWKTKGAGWFIQWHDQEWWVTDSADGLRVSERNSDRALVVPV